MNGTSCAAEQRRALRFHLSQEPSKAYHPTLSAVEPKRLSKAGLLAVISLA